MLVQPVKEFEALSAAARGVGREGQTLQYGEAGLRKPLGALHQTVAQGNRVEAILHGGPNTDQAHAMRKESSPIAVAGSRTQMVGRRSCRSSSSRWGASRRSVLLFRTTIARILAASPTISVCPSCRMSVWNQSE